MVRRLVGLAGVYHIADHFEFEAGRGVEFVSGMGRAMGGNVQKFDENSPTVAITKLSNTQPDFEVHLLHGDQDYVVPSTSSQKFACGLQDAGVPTKLKIVPQLGHGDALFAMLWPDHEHNNTVLDWVLEGI